MKPRIHIGWDGPGSDEEPVFGPNQRRCMTVFLLIAAGFAAWALLL